MRRRHRGVRREQGAVLVEGALCAPLFFLLIFGLVEFGMLFRDHLTLAAAIREGARAGAVAGDDIEADHRILMTLATAGAAMPRYQIDRIVVFKASSPTSSVPAACVSSSAGVAGTCNVYTSADLLAPPASFGCGSGKKDDPWCPTGRDVSQSGPPDLIGVHVEVKRRSVTGLVPSVEQLRSTFIMRLEPGDV